MHILLEKTLKNASNYFQNFLIQEYQNPCIFHRIDARIKFISVIIFVILAVSTFELRKLFFLLFSILGISKIFGLSIKKLLLRIWIFTAFSFIIVLPLIFSNSLYPFIFTLRVFISLLAVQMLIMSTNFFELCIAMRSLKVPEIFVQALWLSYRYIIVLFQDIINVLLARESRRVARSSHYEIWKKGGESIGLFFLRNIEKSERLQLAMLSRGEKIVSGDSDFGTLEISYIAIVAFITLWWIML